MADEKLQFDCERDCPQHGRNDLRITTLEKVSQECRHDRVILMEKLDEVEKDSSKHKEELNRRITERVPIRHAITAGLLIVSVLTTVITININTNNRIEEKIDHVSADVAVLKAVIDERQKQTQFHKRLLDEVQGWREEERKREEKEKRIPYKP